MLAHIANSGPVPLSAPIAAGYYGCCVHQEIIAEIRCQFIILARKDELTSRQESSGKEDSRKLETFQMEPCG